MTFNGNEILSKVKNDFEIFAKNVRCNKAKIFGLCTFFDLFFLRMIFFSRFNCAFLLPNRTEKRIGKRLQQEMHQYCYLMKLSKWY